VKTSWTGCISITLQEEAVRHSNMLLNGQWSSVLRRDSRINGRIATWTHVSKNGGFSLIPLRSVGRQCYSTIEISSFLSNWLMQFMQEKSMRTFRFCCKKYFLKNIGGLQCTELKVTTNADWTAWWIHRDGQVRYCHYRITKYPPWSETTAGQKNMAHHALGDKAKICLSPLHVSLVSLKYLWS